MLVFGIQGALKNDNDNTALWVIGLILLIVCIIYFIKTFKKLLRLIKAPTFDESILGDSHA
jgi:hypothetical protein